MVFLQLTWVLFSILAIFVTDHAFIVSSALTLNTCPCARLTPFYPAPRSWLGHVRDCNAHLAVRLRVLPVHPQLLVYRPSPLLRVYDHPEPIPRTSFDSINTRRSNDRPIIQPIALETGDYRLEGRTGVLQYHPAKWTRKDRYEYGNGQ